MILLARTPTVRERLLNAVLAALVVCALCFLLPQTALASSSPAIVPQPRELHPGDVIPLDDSVSVQADAAHPEDVFAARNLVDTLTRRGVRADFGGTATVRIEMLRLDSPRARQLLAHAHLKFVPAMHDEGYALVPDGHTLCDIADTAAGIFYGAQTIKQLIVGDAGHRALQEATIRDWPAMKYRGMDDDLSRGPVPTLDFQEHQVRLFSEYKLNIYSPYFETTLQYASNPLMAPPDGAMSRADVEQLVQYAQQYHVTIVPEQEAFGHLHLALQNEIYSSLAETPHGSVLAPGQPGSLQLIQQWFTEIASMFPGPFVHIGADETFDLGTGQTKSLVQQEGLGKVYIDFVKQIHDALAPLHKRLLFWGDVAMHDPALVRTLPKDMIAVAWDYQVQPNGYGPWLKPYTDAGMETWVAPSVNDMRVVYPDDNVALRNIQEFVAQGQQAGSTGELNTIWDANNGEGLFNEDWYGVLFSAAAAWQPGTSSIPQFQQSYGQVFHGDLTGKINQAEIELMAAHQALRNAGLPGGSEILFWLDPWSKAGQQAAPKVLAAAHELRMHAEQAIILIHQARAAGPLRERDALDAMELGARRLDFIGYKFQAAQEIEQEYALALSEENNPADRRDVRRLLEIIHSINGQCEDMRDQFGLLRDLYRQAWLRENRPYFLDTILPHYDMNIELWIRRGEQFGEATQAFDQTHRLPRPEELGLPPQNTASPQ